MASLLARAGGVVGPALALAIVVAPPPGDVPLEAWRALALVAWVAVWWLTQPVPLWATSLLPVILAPALGILPLARAARTYADPIVFLLLGGFVIALAVERSGLHRRVGHALLRTTGARPGGVLGGILLATAAVGMWLSVSATALLMLPIVVLLAGARRGAPTRTQSALALAVPYAAALGATATLVATPPVAMLAAAIERHRGAPVGFAEWFLVGGVFAFVGVAAAWVLLRLAMGRAPHAIARVPALPPPDARERRAAALFALVVAGWLAAPWLGVDESAVALVGGALALLVPSGGTGALVSPRDLRDVPWGILVLVGGGLSLGIAATSSGLAEEVAGLLGSLETWPWPLALLALAAATIAISEMSSNTATAAALLPLADPLAASLGLPFVTVATTLGLAACAGFAMPIGTPANAVAYGTGLVPLPRMIRTGVVMDAVAAVLAVAAGALAGLLLG